MVKTLKDEGFRFLRKNGEEMDDDATKAKVRKSFYWLIQRATKLNDEAPAPNDEAPIEPGPKDILIGPLTKKSASHLANTAYLNSVSDVFDEYFNASNKEKKGIARRVIQTLEEQGYRFVEKRDTTGQWAEVGKRAMEEKALKLLRDKDSRKRNPRKRKAPDITRGNDANETILFPQRLTDTEPISPAPLVVATDELPAAATGNPTEPVEEGRLDGA